MIYRDLPVCLLPFNWQEEPRDGLQFDPRPMELGFAPEILDRVQSHARRQLSLSLTLSNADQLAAARAFFLPLAGRAAPFWLPGPDRAVELIEWVSPTKFRIRAQGLAETWLLQPCRDLFFESAGQNPQAARITAVTDSGGGIEEVTLDAAPQPQAYNGWQIRWLHLVRLAEDELQIDWLAPELSHLEIKVLELPLDYATPAAADAKRLAWLYEFALDRAGAVWRYTPRPDTVQAGGFTWKSAALEHGPVKFAPTGNELTLSADADLPPIRRLLAGQLPEGLRLNLYQADLDQGATPTLVWSGLCLKAQLEGRTAKIAVATWLDALDQELPAFWFQQQCNYRVFERATCRLRRQDWEITARIAQIEGRTVTLEGRQLEGIGAHWFAEGWLETGYGETAETALVLDSAAALGDSLAVTLAQPLAHAQPGQRAILLPGCDGLLATCRDKFQNLSNFGGHILPSENLAVSALKPVRKPGSAKK